LPWPVTGMTRPVISSKCKQKLLREFFKLLLSNIHTQYLSRTSEKETDGIELGLLHVYYRQFPPPDYFTRAASGFLTNQFLFLHHRGSPDLCYYPRILSSPSHLGKIRGSSPAPEAAPCPESLAHSQAITRHARKFGRRHRITGRR
jgi:hypothetical protein